MNDIAPKFLTLADLLHRRLFKIPDYQRAYSWTSRERRDLFEDIMKIFEKGTDESHFMATIVCLLRKQKIRHGTDVFDKLDIVDGQQRLTTLILLLNSIKLKLDLKDQDHGKISELLVKADTNDLLLLQSNHDSSHYFEDFLREGKAPSPDSGKTLADRELLKALKECQEFVAAWIEEKRKLPDLYACVKNQLSFILHEISEERLVYTVFEVLNSRGMEVSWLDRLKSMLMGNAFELESGDQQQLISNLHTIWRDIYAQIGLRQGLSTEALRFAATLWQSGRPHRPMSEKDSVDEFRKSAVDAEGIRKIARWILRVTEACDKVISSRRRNAVTRISQARLLAVAIYLRDDIADSDRDELLQRWEKVSFRIYGMMRKDARTRVGDYVTLAWEIVEKRIGVKEIHSRIQSIGRDFPIEDAIKELENSNCYEGWQDEFRYFLFRYEEHLTREAGNNFQNEQWELIWAVSPSDSIEHIFPQGTASDDIRHVLGNLMILPPKLNSKLQDRKPKQKLEAYRQTGLLSANKVASTLRWSKKAVREREKELLQWAATEWAD